MNQADNMYTVKFENFNITLRRAIVDDYWVFEGLFFADEYYPLKLDKESIVLDVGSNIGMSCLLFLKRGAKNIICIEPEPQNFELLNLNVKNNNAGNRVKLVNIAVSDKPEILYFTGTGGTAFAEVYKGNNKISVKADTLDNVLLSLGNPKIDILKMDIEGYEVKALSKFNRLKDIKQVIVETHSKELTERTKEILRNQGFIVNDVSHIRRTKVLKNILVHPFSFYNAEKENEFRTTKSLIRYISRHGNSPVAADNELSEQRIIYGYRS